MWLLSVSQVGLAATSQVVAVRVWPSSTYTRVTVESNRVLKYKQFALSNPERVVVDLEGVNLNSVLKGMAAQIRGDDPFIKSARVGQFDPQTVRMVFELKQNVKPQLFALAPVAMFKERLVMDLYPANATDIQDPLLALLEDYNKGDLTIPFLDEKPNITDDDKASMVKWAQDRAKEPSVWSRVMDWLKPPEGYQDPSPWASMQPQNQPGYPFLQQPELKGSIEVSVKDDRVQVTSVKVNAPGVTMSAQSGVSNVEQD